MDFNGGRRRIPLIEEPRRPPWMLIILVIAAGVVLLWAATSVRIRIDLPKAPVPQGDELVRVAPEAVTQRETVETVETVEPVPPLRAGPKWAYQPSVEYPRAGMRAPGGEGRVVLACVAGADQSLQDCRIVSETPQGYGFGRSALASAREARLSPDARAGAKLQFTVRFTPPVD